MKFILPHHEMEICDAETGILYCSGKGEFLVEDEAVAKRLAEAFKGIIFEIQSIDTLTQSVELVKEVPAEPVTEETPETV